MLGKYQLLYPVTECLKQYGLKQVALQRASPAAMNPQHSFAAPSMTNLPLKKGPGSTSLPGCEWVVGTAMHRMDIVDSACRALWLAAAQQTPAVALPQYAAVSRYLLMINQY